MINNVLQPDEKLVIVTDHSVTTNIITTVSDTRHFCIPEPPLRCNFILSMQKLSRQQSKYFVCGAARVCTPYLRSIAATQDLFEEILHG